MFNLSHLGPVACSNRFSALAMDEAVDQYPSDSLKESEIQLKKDFVFSKRTYVGELHKKWQFPSDHLPIGARINDFQIVSWNVLNNTHMNWVTVKDSQGLNHSMISDFNVVIQPDGLTRRNQFIIEMIEAMMKNSHQVITLQECGLPFIHQLEKALPRDWRLIKMSYTRPDQCTVLFNSTFFSSRSDLAVYEIHGYPRCPSNYLKPIQNVVLQKRDSTHQIVSLFNAHIPGDAHLLWKEDFASYVFKNIKANQVTIAIGDHNFERHEMLKAYQQAGFHLDGFIFHTPWRTNIDPASKEAKGIDHIFVKGADSSISLDPDEIIEGCRLKETISLLHTPATT